MTIILGKLYDALLANGADVETAREAAEEVAILPRLVLSGKVRAFETPIKPPLPQLSDPIWGRNPVGAFLWTKWREKGLHCGPSSPNSTARHSHPLRFWKNGFQDS